MISETETLEEIVLNSYTCCNTPECLLWKKAVIERIEDLQKQVQTNYLKILKNKEDSS